MLNFKCNDPYWKEVKRIKTDIANWIGNLEFPCEFLSEGVELGFRNPSKMVNVINNGDCDADLLIRMIARGNVVNPVIINVNTGEFIRLFITMHFGETIEISTEYANKYIVSIMNEEKKSVWGSKDYKSSFFHLSPGDNLIKYDADESIDNLDVVIYHHQKYLEV